AVAYLLMYLAKNHCFVDGNKRVAWSAAVRVLDMNGIRLREDDAEAAPLVNHVATGEAKVGDIITWLAQPERLREIPTSC
ncbi:MAG: type II toxin-antitoxin system death-on-curing family toxin, partial [Byssovorax sp.]